MSDFLNEMTKALCALAYATGNDDAHKPVVSLQRHHFDLLNACLDVEFGAQSFRADQIALCGTIVRQICSSSDK